MRAIIAAALLGACGFTPGSAGDPAGGGGGGGGTNPDAAEFVRPPCDLTDSSVQLCLDFETSTLGLDSSAGHHDATVVNAVAMTRASEQAVTLTTTSTIRVAETPALDITGAITVELWLDPAAHAPGPDTALDNAGQYTLALQPDNKVRCSIAGMHVDSHDPIANGQWAHAGCTYDGSTLALYIDGSASTCQALSAQISTAGTTGTAIGAPFVGGIDNVHIMNRAVSATEMCAHAGQTDCQSQCD